MAHVISISNGATTITFTEANGYRVLAYDMVTPQADERGGMPDDVAETLEYIVIGSSGTQVQDRIGALDRLLDGVERRRRWGVGPRVYLRLRVDGEASTWRAELLGASPTPQEDTLRLWPNLLATYSLSIQRTGWWESETQVQLPLTNGNGTAVTSGLTICNHEDGTAGNDNYVEIAAADVTGNLPAPLIVELTNTTGAAVQYGQVWMANNAFSDPATLTHVLQAETVVVSGYGTVQSDASCSNGQYTTFAFTNSNAQQYTLSQALLRDTLGYEFHLLVRFKALITAAYVRPSIYDSTGAFRLWMGDEVYLPLISPALADLGVIPLPPGGYTVAAAGLRLRLDWRTSGATAIDTDFFALFPANTFRRLVVSMSCSNNGRITDDPVNGRAWINNGAGEIPAVTPQGMPLLAWPGVLQRVYFLWHQANMAAPIAQTFTVKAWYRPRRRSF